MGIRGLNKLLKINCKKKSIHQINLNSLSNKIIVVDTSIYLYRFKGDEMLIEGFYLMCSLFHINKIYPIFCFDGKPGKEKEDEIEKRKIEKNKAKEEFKKLEKEKEKENNEEKIEKIEEKMDVLRKKFIYIKNNDIKVVKQLLDTFGMTYINSNGEADITCATLMKNDNIYACLSEDMDMFVYGCKRVLRYLSLINSTVIEYNLEKILKQLDMNFYDFQTMCILSGTDYNKFGKPIFAYYNKYKKTKKLIDYNSDNIYIKDKIENDIKDEIEKVRTLFSKEDNIKIDIDKVKKNEINNVKLQEILELDNFIFPEK